MEPEPKIATLTREMMEYYDRAATRNKLSYVTIKLVELIAAAAIPFFALLDWGLRGQIVSAALGSVIVLLEGIQQLFKVHENWMNYRTSCETLRRELFLYESAAGPYGDPGTPPSTVLAERVSGVTTQAVSKWLSVQDRAAKPKDSGA